MIKKILLLIIIILVNISLSYSQLTWELINYDNVTGMAFSGDESFYVTGQFGLYKKASDTSAWMLQSEDLKFKSVFSFYQYKGIILAGTNSYGIFRSTDNGLTFDSADLGGDPWQQAKTIMSFHYHGGRFFAGAFNGNIFYSDDKGITWIKTSPGPTGSVSKFVSVDDNIYTCFNGGGVFRTSDNGISWQLVNNGLPTLSIESLAAIDSTLFAAMFGHGIYKSTDYGSYWVKIESYPFNKNINYLESAGGVLYVGTFEDMSYGGFVYSTDLGETWTRAADNLPSVTVKKIFINGSRVYALGTYPYQAVLPTWLAAPAIQNFKNHDADAPIDPLLRWKMEPGAISYEIQVSGNRTFDNPLVSASDIKDDYFQVSSGILAQNQRYYWRVRYLADSLNETIKKTSLIASRWSDPGVFITSGEIQSVYGDKTLPDNIDFRQSGSRLEFTVNFQGITVLGIYLTDYLGNRVSDIMSIDETRSGSEIDLSLLNTGVYILIANTSHGVFAKKVMYVE